MIDTQGESILLYITSPRFSGLIPSLVQHLTPSLIIILLCIYIGGPLLCCGPGSGVSVGSVSCVHIVDVAAVLGSTRMIWLILLFRCRAGYSYNVHVESAAASTPAGIAM